MTEIVSGGGQSVNCAAAEAGGGGAHCFRKALCIGMLPGETFAQQFALAKAAGFAGVECNPLSDEAQRTAMRRAADDAGIAVHSVMHGGWGAPLSSPDHRAVPESRRTWRSAVKHRRRWRRVCCRSSLLPADPDRPVFPGHGFGCWYLAAGCRV